MSKLNAALKPFFINSTDIQFILDQVNFRPLFDANGDIIVAWTGVGTVYDFYGNVLVLGGTKSAAEAIAQVGSSYQDVTDLSGTRDVSGFWNNLTPELSHYGDTGQIFPRMALADFANLVKYTSWNDFGQNMQHPSSLVNFIAAYSFDGDIAKAQAIIDLATGVRRRYKSGSDKLRLHRVSGTGFYQR